MALWGNNDAVGTAGTSVVSLNLPGSLQAVDREPVADAALGRLLEGGFTPPAAWP